MNVAVSGDFNIFAFLFHNIIMNDMIDILTVEIGPKLRYTTKNLASIVRSIKLRIGQYTWHCLF